MNEPPESDAGSAGRPGKPYLRIVRGEPTSAELAALVTVLAARGTPTAPVSGRPPRSSWADPARRLRTSVRPGPDAWRRSARL